ncbi:MAG: hypothetical protein JXJ22_10790 [Bacteroidales bacterium]|nr:hypothetical protein [Bacteroidales bacterium]
MKKPLILLSLLVILLFCGFTNRQNELDFEVKVSQKIVENQIIYSLEVTIISGVQDFTYTLYDKKPWDGGKEISSSDKTTQYYYIFENVKPGKYLVNVKDGRDFYLFKFVDIK